MTKKAMFRVMMLVVLLIGICGSLYVKPIQAQTFTYDEKSVPAISCVVTSSGGSYVRSGIGTVNVISGDVTVVCPIMRDNPQVTSIPLVQVAIVDNSTTTETYCYTEDDSLINAASTTMPNAATGVAYASTSIKSLQFFPTGLHSYGVSGLICHLGAGNNFNGFFYRETLATDSNN
jgi:hypothetical protein